jgi:membrane associated rhomboid family serine protease
MCRGTPASAYGLRYEPVIESGEYWRLLVAPLVHADPFHLLLNVALLYFMVAGAEAGVLNAMFVLSAGATMISLVYGRVQRALVQASALRHHSGWSSLLVGLLTDAALRAPPNQMWGGIPASVTPFAFLVLTQMLLRNRSLTDHLLGLPMGLILWLGWFDWLTPYWIGCAAVWLLAASVFSLKRVFPRWMGWLQHDPAPARGGGGAGGGIVVTRDPSAAAGECSFMYRYILRESCSQFDLLPLTSLTISCDGT